MIDSDMTDAQFQKSVAVLKPFLKEMPKIGFVLGSGLGALADAIDGVSVPFRDVPGCPSSTSPSHKGAFKIGHYKGRPVIAMQGRLHMYEGYSAAETVFPVQLMAHLGVRQFIITNAAGGIAPHYSGGEIGLIEDHINLPGMTGLDPMRGANDDSLGPRFTSMNGAYSQALLGKAEAAAAKLGLGTKRGVYGFAVGPSLETPAEIRMLRALGCHMVGMSTVPEVIAARNMGCEVLALSAISNLCVDDVRSDKVTTAEEVHAAMEALSPKLHALIAALLPSL